VLIVAQAQLCQLCNYERSLRFIQMPAPQVLRYDVSNRIEPLLDVEVIDSPEPWFAAHPFTCSESVAAIQDFLFEEVNLVSLAMRFDILAKLLKLVRNPRQRAERRLQ